MDLNTEQSAYKKKVVKACLAAVEAEAQYENLRKECSHLIEEVDGWASCVICSLGFGWYCPDSPDHVCHYFTEKNTLVAGKVALIPAGFALPTQEIDPEYETEDKCLFCGNPDERK